MSNRFEDKIIIKFVKFLSPLILSLFGIGVTYGIMKEHAISQDKILASQQQQLRDNYLKHEQYDDRLARIETVINQIPEMRSDIKLILKEVKVK